MTAFLQSLSSELLRKSIHLGFISCMVLLRSYVSDGFFLLVLAVASAVMLAYEGLRHHLPMGKVWFRSILRAHEQHTWTGASYVLLALWTAYFLFPKALYITSFWILAWADTLASLVGQACSQVKGRKTAWGSGAFLLAAWWIVRQSAVATWPAYLSALLVTWVEYRSQAWGWDDNLTVPLAFGMGTVLIGLVF